MHRLTQIKETLIDVVEMELCDLSKVDTKELGEAIDMIKDLEEAIYYCTITEAMENPTYKVEKGDHHMGDRTVYDSAAPRDEREGRSYHSRRTYMEAKEHHKDKAVQLRELEKFM
jgi:hypothetical protein